MIKRCEITQTKHLAEQLKKRLQDHVLCEELPTTALESANYASAIIYYLNNEIAKK